MPPPCSASPREPSTAKANMRRAQLLTTGRLRPIPNCSSSTPPRRTPPRPHRRTPPRLLHAERRLAHTAGRRLALTTGCHLALSTGCFGHPVRVWEGENLNLPTVYSEGHRIPRIQSKMACSFLCPVAAVGLYDAATSASLRADASSSSSLMLYKMWWGRWYLQQQHNLDEEDENWGHLDKDRGLQHH